LQKYKPGCPFNNEQGVIHPVAIAGCGSGWIWIEAKKGLKYDEE
jgi:hypothetical protein